MKSKNYSAAVLSAAIISGFAVCSFACGPDFPNNLLTGGDSAVLQPPIADFQRELERMKLVSTPTRAVPPAASQSLREQTVEKEMADLAAALERKKVYAPHATVILAEHLRQRMRINAYAETYRRWQLEEMWKRKDLAEPVTRQIYIPMPNARELAEFLHTNPPPAFPWLDTMPNPEIPFRRGGLIPRW